MEEKYWDQRYSSGGTSGIGSIGKAKVWKWSVIEKFVPVLNNVVDVGCGDLSFWKGKDCIDYVGIDISQIVIEENRKKRPMWKFICANSGKRIDGLKKEVIFCLDILFHIMDIETFLEILHNICYYSEKYIFIHTWKNNPFTKQYQIKKFLSYLVNLKITSALYALKDLFSTSKKLTDGKYQYFRPIEYYLYIFRENDFKLLKIIENPDEIGALYIFKKNSIHTHTKLKQLKCI